MNKYFKFKKQYYDVIKELSDKQAGELIKGVAAYAFENKPLDTKDGYLKGLFLCAKREIDQSRRDSENGKKGADKLAENKRRRKELGELGVVIGSVIVATEQAKQDKKGE